jgi:Retroviral aspartyl protease
VSSESNQELSPLSATTPLPEVQLSALESEPLRNHPEECGLAAVRHENDLSLRLAAKNTLTGVIGFRNKKRAQILINTGSEKTFVSARFLEEHPDNLKISGSRYPITVKLPNGSKSDCLEEALLPLEIGDFRCVYTYRVLEWDAYNIIMGMD